MEKFFSWLFTAEHIFTLVTVVLSGFISWWISAAYHKKGNRNSLRLNVLFPMRRIIAEPRSWKNYKVLEETSKEHDSKYLTKKERTALTNFLAAYKNVCTYDYAFVCAESLFSYFCYKLDQNGINTKPVPIEIDGETYPLVKVEISSSSHPFFTGKQKLVDTAGRVDKFMNRYQKHFENKKK